MITITHCHEKANNQQSPLKGSVQNNSWQGHYIDQGFIKALRSWIISGKRKGYRSLRSPLGVLGGSFHIGSSGRHLPQPLSHGQQQPLGSKCINQKQIFMHVPLKTVILIWKNILNVKCKHLFSPFFKGKVYFRMCSTVLTHVNPLCQ